MTDCASSRRSIGFTCLRVVWFLLEHAAMRWLVLVPVFATGCSTYAQQRAALVPHATPMMTDGQPLASQGELALGASNIAMVQPSEGNPDAGIEIPSTQLRGAAMIRASPNLTLGGVYERGLSAGAHALQEHQPPVDSDVSGVGLTMTYSIPLNLEGWRLALSSEVLVWSVPWVQYTTCIQNCVGIGGGTTSDKGSDSVPTLAFGLTPSYRTGRVTFFGGITVRNHPTIDPTIRTNIPMDPDVSSGPYNATLHAGAAVELGAGVRASLLVHETITTNPVVYGPSLALMVSIPLGRDADKPPAAATPPYYDHLAPPPIPPTPPPVVTTPPPGPASVDW